MAVAGPSSFSLNQAVLLVKSTKSPPSLDLNRSRRLSSMSCSSDEVKQLQQRQSSATSSKNAHRKKKKHHHRITFAPEPEIVPINYRRHRALVQDSDICKQKDLYSMLLGFLFFFHILKNTSFFFRRSNKNAHRSRCHVDKFPERRRWPSVPTERLLTSGHRRLYASPTSRQTTSQKWRLRQWTDIASAAADACEWRAASVWTHARPIHGQSTTNRSNHRSANL
jgi:hypothetical protein